MTNTFLNFYEHTANDAMDASKNRLDYIEAMRTLLTKLKERRLALNITQNEIAFHTQLTEEIIDNYENCRTMPSTVTLLRWLDALKLECVFYYKK